MKLILVLFGVMITFQPSWGQFYSGGISNPPGVVPVSATPSGSCAYSSLFYNITSGVLTGCAGGTYAAIGAGGSGTVTNIATSGPISGGPITSTGTISCPTCGVTSSPLSQFASTTSAQFAGIISNPTGTGQVVLATSPELTTPTVSGRLQLSVNNIVTTSTEGVGILNVTPATSGVPVQYSPQLHFAGTAWNSSGSASEQHNWVTEIQPAGAAGTTSSTLVVKQTIDSGSFTNLFTLSSVGNASFAGTLSAVTTATVTRSGIAASTSDGLVIQNTTAATSGTTAQWSPRLHFIGSGWKTNATAAAQQVEWLVELQPISRPVAPINVLALTPIRNGSAGSGLAVCQGDSSNNPRIISLIGLDGQGSLRCDGGNGSFSGFGDVNASNIFAYYSNGAQQMNFTSNGLLMKPAGFFAWTSASPPGTASTGDTGLCRGAAGQINVNDGSTTCTTARDAAARTHIGIGSAPTVDATSCTGATIGTGALNSAGTITGLPTGACTVVLTFNGTTATTGWSCGISDQTTGNLFRQTASSTTTATFSGTSVANDVLRYGPCMAY